MSFLGSWVAQQKQLRPQWFGQDRPRRQDFYKEFIQEASKAFVDALQHDKLNVASIVVPYEKVSGMLFPRRRCFLLLNKRSGELSMHYSNRRYRRRAKTFVRCWKAGLPTFSEASAKRVTRNLMSSALNNFEARCAYRGALVES
jgi:hypothetical protein